MARPKSKGAYAPLAAQYYLDDTILEAGPLAELMWVRVLSFLASVPTDGFITERQLRMVGVGLRDWNQRVKRLQEVGLLDAVSGGYVARSWLKWNRTTAEQNRLKAQDRERKAHKHGDTGENSDRKMDSIRTDSRSSREQNSREQNNKDVAEIRPDVSRLCDVLADLIEANGSKRPNIGKGWTDSARLLIDNDKRPLAEALGLMQWAQADSFWRGNILSMPKFREKYDTLRLQREAKAGVPPTKQAAPRRVVSGRARE